MPLATRNTKKIPFHQVLPPYIRRCSLFNMHLACETPPH